jgi:hypothetical protein
MTQAVFRSSRVRSDQQEVAIDFELQLFAM